MTPIRLAIEKWAEKSPNSEDLPVLRGWDFIQESILRHDEDMIADFADDIDTLLVFVSAAQFHSVRGSHNFVFWSRRVFSLPSLLRFLWFRLSYSSPTTRNSRSSCSRCS